jgi:HK97 family phage major capsid protein
MANPLLDKLQALNTQRDALMAKVDTTDAVGLPALSSEIDQIDAAITAVNKLNTAPAATAPAPRGPITVHDNREDAPFSGLGEMLQCVRVAAITPSAIDPRLNPRAAALGANEKVGSEGGFLVGTDISSALEQDMHDAAILAPMCAPVPISNDSNGIEINGVDETSRANGSRFGGVQAYWADEAGTATATKPKFRKIKMKLNKLLAFYYATDEELADASVLAALGQQAFSEEMSFKVDDAIIRGSGAGQPLGVLNSPVLVSVAKETGQQAATVQYENLTKMYARMPARSKRRSTWFINDDVFPQLQTMTIAAGASNVPVYLPPGGASDAPYGTIFGRPVVPIEQCETIGTVGDIILADLSQYKLATKGGLQQASSIHVQFLTGEQVFRFVYRADGQPARSTALTPFKGTATQSPFVVLATRA